MKASSSKRTLLCLSLSILITAAASFAAHEQSNRKRPAATNEPRATTTTTTAPAANGGGVGAVLSGAVLLLGLAVPVSSAGDVMAGEQIFRSNCAACHSGGTNVIMPEKTLEKAALEQYLYGGRSEESIVRQVTNGKNAMPAFGGRLREEEIENVASYVIAKSEAGWNSEEPLSYATAASAAGSDGDRASSSEREPKITYIFDFPSGASLAIVERNPPP